MDFPARLQGQIDPLAEIYADALNLYMRYGRYK